MSFTSASVPSSTTKHMAVEGVGGLVEQLARTGQFLRDLRVKMRFGELTRAPLRLVRLEICEDVVECVWLARASDPWDADLTRGVQQRHVSLQAIRDAIDVRALLFDLMPQIETAYVRVYRESTDYIRELIITGCAHRNDQTSRDVHSLAMRAKVLGFRFNMEGDRLRRIQSHEQMSAGRRTDELTL